METKNLDSVLAEFTRALRQELGENLRSIVLFGSRARGDADESSDYDVIVVVKRETPDLRENLFRLSSEIGFKNDTVISALLYEEEQFDSDKYEPLLMNVCKEGLQI